MVNSVLAMGHQVDPVHCLKFSFPTQIAVHLTKHIYIVFVTGEDDIARFNSRRSTFSVHDGILGIPIKPFLPVCFQNLFSY
jgi:hypothetical protein